MAKDLLGLKSRGSLLGKKKGGLLESGGGREKALVGKNVLLPEESESRLKREMHAVKGAPAAIIGGLVKLGKGLVTDAGTTVPDVGEAILKGLGETVRHVGDPRWLPGGKTPKFIEAARGSTYFETALNDVGNVALIFGGASLAATKAAGGTMQAAKTATAAGNLERAAVLEARAAKLLNVADKSKVIAAPYRTAGRKLVTEPLTRASEAAVVTARAGLPVSKGLEIAGRAGDYVVAGRQVRRKLIGKTKEAGAARETARRSPLSGITNLAAKRLHVLHPELKGKQIDTILGEEITASAERLDVVGEALQKAQAGAGVSPLISAPETPLARMAPNAMVDPEFQNLLAMAKEEYAGFKAAHATGEGVDPGKFQRDDRAIRHEERAKGLVAKAEDLRTQKETLLHQLDDIEAGRAAIDSSRMVQRVDDRGLPIESAALGMMESTKAQARMYGARNARITDLRGSITKLDKQAARLESQAAKTANRALEVEKTTRIKDVPAEYQPIVDLTHRMVASVNENVASGAWTAETAAAINEGMWETVQETIRRMREGELEAPSHTRDFTQAQVEQQAFGHSRLGNAMRKPGQFVEGGFRNERTMALRHQAGESALFGSADKRASGLVLAQAHEVAQEAAANSAVMQLMSEGIIKKWDPKTPIPAGWVPAAPAGLTHSPLEQIFGAAGPNAQAATLLDPRNSYVMPKAVHDQLLKFSAGPGWIDTIFAPLDAFTQEWRSAILPLSPRWNVNNAFGGLIINMANGSAFDLHAWGDGFRQARATLKVGDDLELKVPFGGVDARIISGGIGSEMGFHGGLAEGRGVLGRTPGVRKVIKLSQSLNTSMDNFYRTMTYSHELKGVAKEMKMRLADGSEMLNPDAILEKTLRQEAFTAAERAAVEETVRRATKSMVDYQNLSPFERTVMRRIIPFYAWQKGIAKFAMSLPLDHPLRFAALEYISNYLGGFSKEERENYPDYLVPTVEIGGKLIGTRGLNPFQDAFQLFMPDGSGIKDSLNPLVKAGAQFLMRVPESQYGPKEVGDVGFAQPQVGLGGLLSDIVAGTPAIRAEEALRRAAMDPEDPSRPDATQTLAGFAGLTLRTPEQMLKAQQRLAAGRKTAFESGIRAQAYKTLLSRGATLEMLSGKPTSLLARTGGLSVPQFNTRLVAPKKSAPALVVKDE